MLPGTAGNSPRFTRCPEPHGSLGPGFRARRYRFTPRLFHIMCSTGCAAPGHGSAERGPDPRRSEGCGQPGAARSHSPAQPGHRRCLSPPARGRKRSRAGSFPAAPRLAPRSPPHNFPPAGGEGAGRGPRRALTYTDGVGEPRQSLPQQPRQQQQEGPGRALPHFLQPLRFSP